MSSRGRGRGGVGHGAGASRPGGGAASAGGGGGRPKTPGSIKELGTYLRSLSDSNFAAYGDMFAEMVLSYSKRGTERLQEAVELIFDTTVQSREYAELGAKVCEKIVRDCAGDEAEKKALRGEFKKLLFLKFQQNYKNKEATRVQSVEAWLAIFAFMCEVSPRVRVDPGEKLFAPLSKAILSTIEFLLDQEDVLFDEIDCICSSLKVCGKGIEEQCPEKFNEIFTELRKKLIFGKNGRQARCAILELIEYRYMHWSDPNNTLLDFYADAMADAAAEDTLEGQG